MSIWTILLLLAATFYGPALYAIVGGFGAYLFGSLTQRSRLGCLRATLASLSGEPVVLAMVGVEHGVRFCGVTGDGIHSGVTATGYRNKSDRLSDNVLKGRLP